MKYFLFGGAYYYPNGGWNDLISYSDDFEQLKNKANSKIDIHQYKVDAIDWAHILSVETMEIVFRVDRYNLDKLHGD